MTHYTLDYETMLHQRGFRLTPQRRLILDAICEGQGHTTFDEIYARLKAKRPSINQATLYRALSFFEQVHLVVSAEISGKTVYEIANPQHHHHLLCRKCGWIGVLDHAHLRELAAELLREYGFQADVDHLIVTGLCHKCQTAA